MTTGHSDLRTPAKHDFLGRVLGQEISAARYVAPKLRTPYHEHHFWDLTGGDGFAYHGEGDWHKACSPGLFAHHARFKECLVPVTVHINERAPATFNDLIINLEAHLPDLGYEQVDETVWEMGSYRHEDLSICWTDPAHATQYRPRKRVQIIASNIDSLTEDFSELKRGDFALLNNDPNSIYTWALNIDGLVAAIDRGAVIRSFSTLGCNVGGLKMLDYEKRRQWYDYLKGLVLTVSRPGLDLLLMAIYKDDSQWAYAVVTPTKWIDQTFDAAEKIFTKHKMRIRHFSLRQDPDGFNALVNELFQTKAERGIPTRTRRTSKKGVIA